MEFSRQIYWSGLPFPTPGDLPNPGIKPIAGISFSTVLPGKPPPSRKNLLIDWLYEIRLIIRQEIKLCISKSLKTLLLGHLIFLNIGLDTNTETKALHQYARIHSNYGQLICNTVPILNNWQFKWKWILNISLFKINQKKILVPSISQKLSSIRT